jgi:hypothetical protein
MAPGLFGNRPLTKTRPHVSSGAVSCNNSCQLVREAVNPSAPKSLDLATLETSHVVKHWAGSWY